MLCEFCEVVLEVEWVGVVFVLDGNLCVVQEVILGNLLGVDGKWVENLVKKNWQVLNCFIMGGVLLQFYLEDCGWVEESVMFIVCYWV